MTSETRYASFREFYPFYLSQHRDPVCRMLHYVGTAAAAAIMIYGAVSARWVLIPAGLVTGYAFAWVGHFFFENNRPATFQYPLWSFMGDWVMLKDFLSGRLSERQPD